MTDDTYSGTTEQEYEHSSYIPKFCPFLYNHKDLTWKKERKKETKHDTDTFIWLTY